ncbi:MAG TPA: 5-(carboxyamino)imidazole ribonucleotide synthase [Steroidobacteraceae bacterium]|nr:5-(carboxyamino)imidazole ribonucleotide synthase [Steroidobacteraceae bacterium]
MTFSKVGIIGAGQLGRMLALAGYPLGLHCLFLDRSPHAPGAQVAPILVGDLEDPGKLMELAKRSDVLTFDWENIAGAALAPLEKATNVRPPRRALEISQDRLLEKALFQSLKIPVAAHVAVDSKEDLVRAVRRLGARGVLKTRRLGYDGKGQYVLQRTEDVDGAWAHVGGPGLIYEQFQNFSREVSIIGARSAAGEIVYYPLSSNTHSGGILRYCVAPFVNRTLERTARRCLKKLMESLGYIGVLTIEFFVVKGRLIANEMAPRVHNSGHWTIEGCITSQFENHLRAICGMPLGSTRALGHTAMINFLGEMPPMTRLLSIEGLGFHDYGKEPRPGRKLGHCSITRAHARDRNRALADALQLVQWS